MEIAVDLPLPGAGAFHRFEELCHKLVGQIAAVADSPFFDRLRELAIPAPKLPSVPIARVMAWIERVAPKELPRAIALAQREPPKPFGRLDLFAKLSEWNIPAATTPDVAEARQRRWRRWHAEAASPTRGLAA